MEAIKKEKEQQERRNRLAVIGVGFNGQMWNFQNINLPDALLRVCSNEQFEQFYGEFLKAAAAEELANQADDLRRELQRIAAERITKILREEAENL